MVSKETKIIENHQYEGCHYTRVFVPNRVKEIQNNAFRNCKNLKEVVFEARSVLKKIGNYAFDGCKNLRNIRLPDGLETIGVYCFSGCGLEEVVLPASVKSVGPCAFSRCE